ncbi:lantibiotic dehydratase [Kutzneria buriramensis]|uniref:Lantibiotic biosynthesis dehydratase-like protein n=1 Tax=Kutzneria buriramensis TaxID=1045776 RepID=A0A3E0HZR8_9PSEU|nr:lantibiotic dehydratase [Kutzneria buriramensis]REH51962.1 lantibiotic biosynthesis dehydratase-like protein [Kutzneria buriramensis]
MPDDALTIGAGGLLRVAGLPARLWTAVGNPELFTLLRERTCERSSYARFAETLAERLGAELVPHPYLEPEERAELLALRRLLHRGEPVPEEDCYRVAGAVSGLNAELADDLTHAGDWSTAMVARLAQAESALHAERERLSDLPWRLVNSSEFAMRAVTEAAPGMVDDIRRRLSFGETWDSKRLRHRSDYLLRVLARGAAKPAPRDWLGHVALLAVGERSGAWTSVGESAANRVAATRGDRALPDLVGATVAMTGLNWIDRDHLCCWVVDAVDGGTMRRLKIRRTPALDAIRRALSTGACEADELVMRLSSDAPDVLRGYLRHLAGLGVLTVSAPPSSELTGWGPTAAAPPKPGLVDVYRRAGGTMPTEAASRLQNLLAQAGRVGAVLAAAAAPAPEHPILALVGPQPRPVTEVLAEFLGAHEDSREPALHEWDGGVPRQRPGWPAPPSDVDTPYGRLLALLDTDADQVTLTPQLLDEIGAPPVATPAWPVDCLVRPIGVGGGHGAVLEGAAPAGVVDARFVEALRHLHGELPHVTAYRTFLDELGRRCGAETVEILVPPQDPQAVGAVRRPRLCPMWTGEADSSAYQPAGGRHLPLDRITVRRVGDRIVAEDTDAPDGLALWPMYHSARAPLAPWGLLVTLLTAASPVRRLAGPLVLGNPLAALPDRNRLPRLVLAGGLVLSGAQWRIPREQLPAADLPSDERIRAIAALRIGTGIPRWVFARSQGGHQPRPVDLDCLSAVRALDKLLADDPESGLVFEEMLPDPHHLPLRDADGEPVAGQLLARLPVDATPGRLAARAMLAWNGVVNAEQERALPRQRDNAGSAVPV